MSKPKKEVTLEEQLVEVKRDLASRKENYPRQIFAGKLNRGQAEHRVAVLETIIKTIERLIMLEQIFDDIKNHTIAFPSLDEDQRPPEH